MRIGHPDSLLFETAQESAIPGSQSPRCRASDDSAEIQKSYFINLQVADGQGVLEVRRMYYALLGRHIVRTSASGVDYIDRNPPDQIPLSNAFAVPIRTEETEKYSCTGVTDLRPHGLPMGAAVADVNFPQYRTFLASCRYELVPWNIKPNSEVTPLAITAATGAIYPPTVDIPDPDVPDEGFALMAGWGRSRYVSKFVQPAPRALSIKSGLVHFVKDASTPWLNYAIQGGGPIPEGTVITQYRANIKYIWHHVPLAAVPFNRIAEFSGGVNLSPFDGYPAGTLLMSGGPSIRTYTWPTGTRLAELEYNMIYQPNATRDFNGTLHFNGWNSVLRTVQHPSHGLGILQPWETNILMWWPVTADPGGTFPDPEQEGPRKSAVYKYHPFEDLFRPEWY